MSPSKNEFYTGGGYLQNNPGWHSEDALWKSSIINKIIIKNNLLPSEVVEIGCGAGAILLELSKLNTTIKNLKGYDISPQAIVLAKQYENERLQFYNEDYFLSHHNHTHFLLMIDVLEHVEDYIGFLKKLKNSSDYFVFHIPLDLCCRTILRPHSLYQQRQSVGHIHYFSKEIIEWALIDAGYEIIDQVYTKPVIDVVPATSFKRAVKKLLRNFSYSINEGWSAKNWGGYSIMFLLK
ncbi:MAG: class I SAM-dependent methyltransferase [Ferruginibacter sp.]